MADDLERPEPGGLLAKTSRSVRWSIASQAALIALQLPYTAATGRLLSPADFGVVALASIGLRFVSFFAQMGVQSAVIQAPSISRQDLQALQCRAVANAFLFAGGLAALAPLAGRYMHQPALALAIPVLSIDLVLNAAASTGTAMLRRTFRYRELATLEVGSFLVGYLGLGLGAAALGAGYWSLIVATLTASFIRACASTLISGTAPKPAWRLAPGSRFTSFGRRLSFVSFLEFWAGSLDSFFVGRWMSSSALGQYSRASQLSWFPAQQVGASITRVLLGTFSVQRASDAARSLAYGLALMEGLLVPCLTWLGVNSKVVVALVLGDHWQAAAAILPLIAAASLLDTLAQLPSVAFEGRGRVVPKLVAQVVQITAIVIGLATVVLVGPTLTSVAVSWLAAEAVSLVTLMLFAQRVLGLDLPTVTLDLVKTCLFSLPIAAAAIAPGMFGLKGIGAVASLVALVASAVWIPWWPWKTAFREMQLVRHAVPRRLAWIADWALQ